MSRRSERLEWLLSLEPAERHARLHKLKDSGKRELRYHWHLWAATAQLAPPGDWSTWLIMAGRGFGKTRAGAEWLRDVADHDPDARIALLGATLNEVRAVMVEGESGILSITPRGRRPRDALALAQHDGHSDLQFRCSAAASPAAASPASSASSASAADDDLPGWHRGWRERSVPDAAAAAAGAGTRLSHGLKSSAMEKGRNGNVPALFVWEVLRRFDARYA